MRKDRDRGSPGSSMPLSLAHGRGRRMLRERGGGALAIGSAHRHPASLATPS
jgi:hypothetical protein